MSLLEMQTEDLTESIDTPISSPLRRPRLRRRLLTAGASTLVLAVAATGVWTALSKTVTISVDGQTRQVTTLAGSVSGALDAAGLSLTAHDTVAPAADQSITNGSAIALNRGRLITVTIDGQTHSLWTTALTVDQALAELGQDRSNLELSADRSRTIPIQGMSLTAATLHVVSIADGGGSVTTSASSAATVGDMLAEKNIVIGAADSVTPALTTPIADNLAVSITRTVVSTSVENEPVAQPADVTTDDSNVAKGTSTVTAAGSPGTAAVTYQITTVNGAQTGKQEVARAVTVAPVASQVTVGTKTSLTYVGNQVFFHDNEFGVNWDGLANCESTHNPRAINSSGHTGLFQFDDRTWHSVGGAGRAYDASPEEQLVRAKLLYKSRGLEPWACAHAAR